MLFKVPVVLTYFLLFFSSIAPGGSAKQFSERYWTGEKKRIIDAARANVERHMVSEKVESCVENYYEGLNRAFDRREFNREEGLKIIQGKVGLLADGNHAVHLKVWYEYQKKYHDMADRLGIFRQKMTFPPTNKMGKFRLFRSYIQRHREDWEGFEVNIFQDSGNGEYDNILGYVKWEEMVYIMRDDIYSNKMKLYLNWDSVNNRSEFKFSSVRFWTAVIAHELAHTIGYSHPRDIDDPFYPHSFPEVYGNCVAFQGDYQYGAISYRNWECGCHKATSDKAWMDRPIRIQSIRQ